MRLPEAVTLQMMNDEPRIWRSVQGDVHTALMKFDRVVAIAFDECFLSAGCTSVENGSPSRLFGSSREPDAITPSPAV